MLGVVLLGVGGEMMMLLLAAAVALVWSGRGEGQEAGRRRGDCVQDEGPCVCACGEGDGVSVCVVLCFMPSVVHGNCGASAPFEARLSFGPYTFLSLVLPLLPAPLLPCPHSSAARNP